MFTLWESLDDEGEVGKSKKDNVEFLEAEKNAPEGFQTMKSRSTSLRFCTVGESYYQGSSRLDFALEGPRHFHPCSAK